MVGAPRKHLEIEGATRDLGDGVQALDGFSGDILADAISCDYCDTHKRRS